MTNPVVDPLARYELVNSAETAVALQSAILSFADEDGYIQGRTHKFSAEWMASKVEMVISGTAPANNLTREWGIRQQALYLRHYK